VAVVTFGVSTIIFHFFIQQLYTDKNFNPVETFRILRTSMNLNEESIPYITKSKIWPLIVARTLGPALTVDTKVRIALQQLSCVVIQAMNTDQPNSEINRHAFWELREWIFVCQGKPRTWRHYLIWPAAVGEEYLALLSDADEIALLILIYWCAIMYQSPRRWFITAWAKRTGLLAKSLLNANWDETLAWPLDVLNRVPIVAPETILNTFGS
jgi:hypothetical protein